MEKVVIYRTNRFWASVLALLGWGLIFSVDIDRLFVFYKDPWGIAIVTLLGIVSPLLAFFGFALKVKSGEVVNISCFVFRKTFNISDLSHVLYQPTWAGATSQSSPTTMRSLHIVRNSGGWRQTISLANGVFNESDLADIARRLKQLNPRITFDEQAEALMKIHV
jgi:hypothetical protein